MIDIKLNKMYKLTKKAMSYNEISADRMYAINNPRTFGYVGKPGFIFSDPYSIEDIKDVLLDWYMTKNAIYSEYPTYVIPLDEGLLMDDGQCYCAYLINEFGECMTMVSASDLESI